MPLTIDEILEHEERLRQEIASRERLLAAYQIFRADMANIQRPKLYGSDAHVGTSTALLSVSATGPPLKPAALPAPAPVRPYIHPELASFGSQHGSDGKIVWWAIRRMTVNYTLRDIAALLEREGCNMPSPQISVVLSRLKARGEIEEVVRGGGRTPAMYRKPDNATSQEGEPAEHTGDAESTTGSAATT